MLFSEWLPLPARMLSSEVKGSGRSDGGCVRDLTEGRIMGLSHGKHLAHSAPKRMKG